MPENWILPGPSKPDELCETIQQGKILLLKIVKDCIANDDQHYNVYFRVGDFETGEQTSFSHLVFFQFRLP